MKSYKYYILKFTPDSITKEFVNIGIIAYCEDEKILKFRTKKNLGRVNVFFYGVDLAQLVVVLNNIEKKVKQVDENFRLNQPFNFERFIIETIPFNDSMLTVSEQYIGATGNFEMSFRDLYDNLIARYDFHPNKLKEFYLIKLTDTQTVFHNGFELVTYQELLSVEPSVKKHGHFKIRENVKIVEKTVKQPISNTI